jgi:hypothetical protein
MVKNYLPSVPITVPGSKIILYEGQTIGGRNEERKPTQTNIFEEEENEPEEVNYHEKMKFS